MRKLLLLLFLFSLSSNALAKVEIWKCDNDMWYKIDTSIPMVFERKDFKWEQLYTTLKVEYKKDDGTIWVHDYDEDAQKTEGMQRQAVWDLETRRYVMYPDLYLNSLNYSCRVIE